MGNNIQDIVSNIVKSSQDDKKEKVDVIQLVVFSLDNEEYAVPISDLLEIIKIPEITHVPNTPEFITGISNLRGKIVVVLDLEKRFELKHTSKKKPQHLIIAEVNQNTFGIAVDMVTEVIQIPASLIQETPNVISSKIHSEYLKGVVVLSNKNNEKEDAADVEKQEQSRLLILLDLPKMLQEKELLAIGDEIENITDRA
jgi:purine-binding chemotaxis protein CheW